MHPHTTGISAQTRVPEPPGLSTSSVPFSASTRSASPRRPEPSKGSAPPTPSSRTSTTARSPARPSRMATDVAWAYFATFARDSETT
jgi:hypothetical protein